MAYDILRRILSEMPVEQKQGIYYDFLERTLKNGEEKMAYDILRKILSDMPFEQQQKVVSSDILSRILEENPEKMSYDILREILSNMPTEQKQETISDVLDGMSKEDLQRIQLEINSRLQGK